VRTRQGLAVQLAGEYHLPAGFAGVRDVPRFAVIEGGYDRSSATGERMYDGGGGKKRVDHHDDLVRQTFRIKVFLAQYDVQLAVGHVQ
jgi:hypothetical protein